MVFITWRKEFSVQIEEIDDQHKKLVAMINDLDNLRGDKKETIEEVLMRMVEYAQFHFKTEEDYFEKFHYDKKEEHIKQHHKFLIKASEFYDKFKKDEEILDVIASYLKTWLLEHIMISDHSYIKCFKEHGLK